MAVPIQTIISFIYLVKFICVEYEVRICAQIRLDRFRCG